MKWDFYIYSCQGSKLPPGPSPPDLLSKQLTFLPPVLFDGVPPFTEFGDVVKDVNKAPYKVVSMKDWMQDRMEHTSIWSMCTSFANIRTVHLLVFKILSDSQNVTETVPDWK